MVAIRALKFSPSTTRKNKLRTNKLTLPSIPRGLMNKNFVYVNKDHTNVADTFAKERARLANIDQVFEQVSALLPWTRPATAPRSRLYRA